MNTPIFIRVRDANNTYAATHGGMRATCTQGPRQAAQRLAEKLWPDRNVQLTDAGTDNSDNAKGAQHCFRVNLEGGKS